MNPKGPEKDETMGLFLNDDVVKLARERIQAEEPDYPIELSLGKESSTVVVSRNKDDLIPLAEVGYNGKIYYIGVMR